MSSSPRTGTPPVTSFASSHSGKQPFDTVTLSYGPAGPVAGSLCAGHGRAPSSRGSRDPPCPADHTQGLSQAYRLVLGLLRGRRHDADRAHRLPERSRAQRGVPLRLATDFCVLWSAIDARKAGFGAPVIEDACRGIDADGSLARRGGTCRAPGSSASSPPTSRGSGATAANQSRPSPCQSTCAADEAEERGGGRRLPARGPGHPGHREPPAASATPGRVFPINPKYGEILGPPLLPRPRRRRPSPPTRSSSPSPRPTCRRSWRRRPARGVRGGGRPVERVRRGGRRAGASARRALERLAAERGPPDLRAELLRRLQRPRSAPRRSAPTSPRRRGRARSRWSPRAADSATPSPST